MKQKMRAVFADTAYWIALIDRQDDLHQKALALSETLGDYTVTITTELVLVELMNAFSKRPFLKETASLFVEEAMSDDFLITVIPITQGPYFNTGSFKRSLDVYRQARDKQWSFVDCASFTTMKEMGITEALTHDKHFEQAGFIALMRP